MAIDKRIWSNIRHIFGDINTCKTIILEPFVGGTYSLKLEKAKRFIKSFKNNNYRIVDKTIEEGLSTAEALELFYKDDNYEYYFPSIKSDYVVVIDQDNNEINIKDALNNKMIKINDLEKANIKFYKEDSKTTNIKFKFQNKNKKEYTL
mgnify:CR=1 FL=1